MPIPPRYGVVQGLLREFLPAPGDSLFAERMVVRRSLASGLEPGGGPPSLLRPLYRPSRRRSAGLPDVPAGQVLRAWYPVEVLRFPTAGADDDSVGGGGVPRHFRRHACGGRAPARRAQDAPPPGEGRVPDACRRARARSAFAPRTSWTTRPTPSSARPLARSISRAWTPTFETSRTGLRGSRSGSGRAFCGMFDASSDGKGLQACQLASLR